MFFFSKTRHLYDIKKSESRIPCAFIASFYICVFHILTIVSLYIIIHSTIVIVIIIYSETWKLGTPKGLSKTVLNSEVVLFLRSISTYCIRLWTEVAALNSQGVPISQVVLKTGFTVH